MFDRIAGVYDRMNAVMTAGLHHQWRRRAADLAGVGPGDRVLDVATGTGDLALELARARRARREVVGADFSERMLELAREKAPARRSRRGRSSASSRPTRSRCPTPTTSSTRPRSASARATSPTCDAGSGARWRGSSGPAAAWWCWRSRPRTGRRCRRSSSCGSTTSSRRSAASPATPTPTATCPTRCGGSRRPRSWPPSCGALRPALGPLRAHRRRDHRAARRRGAA